MSLRRSIIKLAQANPDLRGHLLPLLRKTAASTRMVAKTPKAVQSWFMKNTLQRGQLLTVWVGRGRDDYFKIQITGVELWPPLDKPKMWPREPSMGTPRHKDTYTYKILREPSYPGERQIGDLTVRGFRMGGVAVEINGQRVFKLGLGADGRMASDKTAVTRYDVDGEMLTKGRFTPGGLEKPKMAGVSASNLRRAAIKLANDKPELRQHLVPILRRTAGREHGETGKGYGMTGPDVRGPGAWQPKPKGS